MEIKPAAIYNVQHKSCRVVRKALAQNRLRISDNVSESTLEKLQPYYEGLKQLAEKYDFHFVICPYQSNKSRSIGTKIIGKGEPVVYTKNMHVADAIRQVYESVSNALRKA